LALSAAVQKREFLRRHERGWPPFLIERARLVAVVRGLAAPVEHFYGQPPGQGGPALEFAREVIGGLRALIRREGEACRIDAVVDSAPPASRFGLENETAHIPTHAAVEGTHTSLRNRIKAAGSLHGVLEAGTATVTLSYRSQPTPEAIADLLQFAWQQTQVVRLRFCRSHGPDTVAEI
jgi:hypothetical protein